MTQDFLCIPVIMCSCIFCGDPVFFCQAKLYLAFFVAPFGLTRYTAKEILHFQGLIFTLSNNEFT